MSVRYSENLIKTLESTEIEPILVLQIDGVPFLIGSNTIKKIARYGDEELFYGDEGLVYGGLVAIKNQKTLITLDGTSTRITQDLNIDSARGSSVSSMQISLVDLLGEASKIAGGAYGEIIFKDVKLWVGFSDQADFNNDYILIFRGVIESADAAQGKVTLYLSNSDQKKRQAVALKAETALTANISNVSTSIPVENADAFLIPPVPTFFIPRVYALKTYLKINDEIIEYTLKSGDILANCNRGQLGTIATSHSIGDTVESFYVLEGHPLDIALELMLSNASQSVYASIPINTVGTVLTKSIPNAIYFSGVNLPRDHGTILGDLVNLNGMQNNADGTFVVTGITVVDTGTYIFINGDLANEGPGPIVDFISQYNVYNDFGIGMKPEEVDVLRHIELRDSFLANYTVRFFIKEEIEDVKDFIETQLYKPIGCYSLPSDKQGLSRLSVGINLPPLPIEQIQEISVDTLVKPENIKQRRSVNKYHYNAVVFKYEDTPQEDELNRSIVTSVGTQIVSSGNKVFRIEAKGFRQGFGAANFANVISTRILNRYKGAAEEYAGIEVIFSQGVLINIGDVVIFNPTGLNVLNRNDQSRNKPPVLLECINKTTDIKGKTTLTLIDTNFDINARYGLFSHSSKIVKANSLKNFLIEHWNGPDFSSYGINEGQKYAGILPLAVEIHSSDYTQSYNTVMLSVSGNIVEMQDEAPFPIIDGQFFIKLANYNLQKESIKLVYSFLSNGNNNFDDNKPPYTFFG